MFYDNFYKDKIFKKFICLNKENNLKILSKYY